MSSFNVIFTFVLFEGDNGYKIVKGNILDTGEEAMFVGYFMPINTDDTFLIDVKEISHPKYGIQYEVKNISKHVISSDEKLIEYFSSGLFFGIGKKTAEKIVNKLGSDAIKLILETPDILYEIGLSERKILKFAAKLKELNDSSNVFGELISLGFSQKYATQIYNDFGEEIVSKLKVDPFYIYYKNSRKYSYKLCNEFVKKVDLEFDKIVIDAAYLYYYIGDKLFSNGDTFLYLKDIELEIDLAECIKHLDQYNIIHYDDELITYIVYYQAEKKIANFVKNADNSNKSKIDVESYRTFYDIALSASQEAAVNNVVNNQISIITGGPGTGKTTILKIVCNILLNYYSLNMNDSIYDSEIAVLAPTGRAAKRLYESTGIVAATIHRYLKWDLDNNSFLYNESNKANAKIVVVDEFSMMDIMLFSSLLSALNDNVILILVGDERQLPSVECGNVLSDLLSSNAIPTYHLDKVHRQDSASLVDFMHSVRNYTVPSDLLVKYAERAFIRCSESHLKEAIEQILNKILDRNMSVFDFIILVPMYKGSVGIDNLNKMCQEIFNGSELRMLKIGGSIFKVSDKVLLTKNYPNENVYNGDIGYIMELSHGDKYYMKINFDGNIVEFSGEDVFAITLGYAISIHKSQGSEFKNVIVPVSLSYSKMLQNNLIYTAITRAKNSLTIIGEESVFTNCVCNKKVSTRVSLLGKILNEHKDVSPYDFM